MAMLVVGVGGAGCAAPSGGTTPPGTDAASATAAVGESATAPREPARQVTAADLRAAALRAADLGTGWTAEPLPEPELAGHDENPCQRPYSRDADRTAVHGVALARTGRPAQVAQTLAAYRTGTSGAALSEVSEIAQACPRYRQRSSDGTELTVEMVLDKAPPPFGDDRVLLARRITADTRVLYSVYLVFRDGDVLATISTAASSAQQAGELAGVAAYRAVQRIADERLGS